MQFGTMNLFPLVSLAARYANYYMAADGTIYSTKTTKVPRKMHGSGYGNMKYYTLNSASVNGQTLVAQAKVHKDFVKETTRLASATEVVASRLDAKRGAVPRAHAPSCATGISSKGVVIARVATHEGVDHLQFGSQPAIHLTEASYKDEMQRLAMQYPGVKFVAVKIVASVVAGGVKWE